MWLCPSKDCPDQSRYKNGDACKTCGLKVTDFGVRSSFHHMQSKRHAGKKVVQKISVEDMAKKIIEENKSLIQQNETMLKVLGKEKEEPAE